MASVENIILSLFPLKTLLKLLIIFLCINPQGQLSEETKFWKPESMKNLESQNLTLKQAEKLSISPKESEKDSNWQQHVLLKLREKIGRLVENLFKKQLYPLLKQTGKLSFFEKVILRSR